MKVEGAKDKTECKGCITVPVPLQVCVNFIDESDILAEGTS